MNNLIFEIPQKEIPLALCTVLSLVQLYGTEYEMICNHRQCMRFSPEIHNVGKPSFIESIHYCMYNFDTCHKCITFCSTIMINMNLGRNIQ